MRNRYAYFVLAAAVLFGTACGSQTSQTPATAGTTMTETESAGTSGTEDIEIEESVQEETVSSTEAGEESSAGNDQIDETGNIGESAETGENQPEGPGPGGKHGEHDGARPEGGGPGGRQGGGQTDKSSDSELQAMIAEVAPKFELLTFEDEESGISLQYQLYVPENYDSSEKYPLIQFIPDSSVVGRDADYVLTQGWGGLIWATDEEQTKHPSFVVVPVFTETVVDDNFNHSGQIDVAVRLIQHLTEEYSIDTDRLYTTGQSMGGMTSFYLNIAYPDLFAASWFVGSQWDTSLLDILENKDFFYVVSAGDPKASAGQAELMALFDSDGASYSHAEWSAQDEADTQNAAVNNLLSEGNKGNFVTFTLGTTVSGDNAGNSMAGEHMTSFDYAYKLEAVRDWLFSQSKK